MPKLPNPSELRPITDSSLPSPESLRPVRDNKLPDPKQLKPAAQQKPVKIEQSDKDLMTEYVKTAARQEELPEDKQKELSEIFAKEIEEPTRLDALITGVGKGALVGLGDELYGLGVATVMKAHGVEKPFKELYMQARDKARSYEEEAEAEYPGTAITSDVVASILGPGKFVKGARAIGALGAAEMAARSEAELVGNTKEYTRFAAETVIGGAIGYGAAKGLTKLESVINAKAAKAAEGVGELSNKIQKKVGEELDDITTYAKSIGEVQSKNKISSVSNSLKKEINSFKTIAKEIDDETVSKLAAKAKPAVKDKQKMIKKLQKLPKLRSKIGADTLAEARKDPDGWFLLEMKLNNIKGLSTQQYKAFKAWNSEMRDFAYWQIKKQSPKSLKGVLGKKNIEDRVNQVIRQGRTDRKAYEQFRYHKAAMKVVKEKNKEIQVGRIPKYEDALDNIIVRKGADLRFAANHIDHKTGLEITPKIDNLYIADNKLSNFQYKFGLIGEKTIKDIEKVGIDPNDVYKYIENPNLLQGLEAPKRKAIEKLSKEWADIRNFVNEKYGLAIAEKANYVRQQAKELPELIGELKRWNKEVDRNKITKLLKQPTDKEGKIALKKLWESKEYKPEVQFLESLENISDRKIAGLADVDYTIKNIDTLTREKFTTSYQVSAAFKRRKEIPERLRERNIYKLWHTYVRNTGKGVFYDPVLRDLTIQSNILDELGLKNSSNYIKRYIRDMSGIPTKVERSAQRIDESLDAFFGKTLSPERAEMARVLIKRPLQSIYPAYMGANMVATGRNLTQPMMMTAGEIGGIEGRKIALKAYKEAAAEAIADPKKWFSTTENAATKLKLAPTKIKLEGTSELNEKLKRGVFGKLHTKVKRVEDALMYFYSQSHYVNVGVTQKMAKEVTNTLMEASALERKGAKLLRKHRAIKRFIDTLEPGYRSTIKRGLQEGQGRQAIEDELTKYLVAKTQLVYGKIGKGELQRDAGTILTMFTKWPFHVGSEIVATTKHSGTAGVYKVFDKYLGPYAALCLAGAAGIGGYDWTYYSPLTSVERPGNIVKSPVVSGLSGVIEDGFRVAEGELGTTEAIKKRAEGFLRSGVPILSTGINTYDRMQQSTFIKKKRRK